MRTFKHITLGVFLTLMAVVAPASGEMVQAPVNSSFWVDFAQRLVDRGQYDEARGVLEKLSPDERNAPPVKELLEKVQNPPAATAKRGSSIQELASQIAAIQEHIKRYEEHNHDLEFLIRQLVQENDVLAQTLARRNRDLLELMKKVYGEDATLPEVKADVEHTRRILDGYQSQIAERDEQLMTRNQELAQINRQINELNGSLRSLDREQTTSKDEGELTKDLKDKRDDLVDKSMAVADKSRELASMQNDVARFSDTLKETDAKYAAVLKEYDAKLQGVKDAWAQDKSRQSETINQLRDELLTKTKELERLQNRAAAQAPALDEHKEKLAAQDQAIAHVDAAVLDKDKEILKLQGLLKEQDQQITAQRSTIGQQGELIDFVGEKAKDLKKRVVGIRQSLTQQDRELKDLGNTILQWKGRGQAVTNDDVQARLADWKDRLGQAVKDLREKDLTISQLKRQMDDAQTQSEAKDAVLSDLRTQLKEAKDQLIASRQKMEIVLESLNSYKANATTAADRAAALSEKLYDLEERLQKDVSDTAQENKFLHDTLDQRDRDLEAVKKDLMTKNEQLKFFYGKMTSATKTLEANALSHDQTPTPPSWSSAADAGAVPGGESWNPKDNDAYALQQRLTTLTKEVQSVRRELADKNDKLNALQSQLSAREQELQAQKEDYTRILSADKAQDQSQQRRQGTQPPAAPDGKSVAALQASYSVDKYRNDVDQLSEQLKAKDKVVDELTAKLDQKSKELVDLQDQLKEKTDQVQLQQQAIDHETQKFETLKKELGEANKVVGVSQNNFSNKDLKIQDLQDRLNNAKIKERDYKRQISAIEGHLRESYKMVKQGETRLNNLKEQLTAKQNRIKALEDEIARLRKLLHERNTPVQDSL
jgi:chromosome segregation ATPase